MLDGKAAGGRLAIDRHVCESIHSVVSRLALSDWLDSFSNHAVTVKDGAAVKMTGVSDMTDSMTDNGKSRIWSTTSKTWDNDLIVELIQTGDIDMIDKIVKILKDRLK